MVMLADGGAGRAAHTVAPPPPAPAPTTRTADRAEREAVPVRARSGPAASPALQAAAQRTDQAARQAEAAQQHVQALEQVPVMHRPALRGELEQARIEASQTRTQARQAVTDERQLAQQTLSPAYLERYEEDLAAAHPGLAPPVAAPAAAASTVPGTSPEIQSKLQAAEQAEQAYQDAAQAAPRNPEYRQEVLAPLRREADARWQAVSDALRSDLAGASVPAGVPVQADAVALRADQLARLAPDNPTFQKLLADAKADVSANRQAQRDALEVQRVYQEQGAAAAAAELDRRAASGTPDQAQRLMQAAAPTLQHIVSDLAASKDQKQLNEAVASLSRAAAQAGPQATQDLARSLAAAFDEKGVVTRVAGGGRGGGTYPVREFLLDNALRNAVASGAGAELAVATADALRAVGKADAAGKVDQALAAGVQDLKAQYDAAQDQVAVLNQELQQDLARLGPALTPEQRAAYVKAFWADTQAPTDEAHKGQPSHAAALAQADASGDALAKALQAGGPALQRAAVGGNQDAAQALLEGHESLATSPEHAQQSLEWMADVGNDAAAFQAIDAATDGKLVDRLADGIGAEGMAAVAGKLTADVNATDDPALIAQLYDNFSALLGRIGQARQLGALKGDLLKAQQDIQHLRDLFAHVPLDRLDGAALKRYQRGVKAAAEDMLGGWDSKSKFGKSLALAGLAVGLIDAGKAFHDGEMLQGVLASVSAGKDAAEIGIGLLKIAADAGKVSGEFATGASKLGGKFLPLVGLGLDLIQAKGDVDALRSNPNAGEVVAMVGTVLSLASDVAEVVPILGTGIGAVLGTVGEILHAVGGFIDQLIEGDQAAQARDARTLQYLGAAGIAEPDAKALMDDSQGIALLDNFNMPPQQLRSLLGEIRRADGDHQAVAKHMMLLAAGLGLQGDQAAAFIRQGLAVKDAGDVQYQVTVGDLSVSPYPDAFLRQALIDPNTPADLRAQLTQEWRTSQLAWLKAELPEVYDSLFLGHNTPLGEVNVGLLADFQGLIYGEDIVGRSAA
ncbi:hypothetical protein BurJ1DRAFT_2580 [Burkholderiales bacterium JOSHI_001]|nr:hypothetical protein BurJ1DRAFT_2580 [Burkholderiales bacterium JOSHI_001]